MKRRSVLTGLAAGVAGIGLAGEASTRAVAAPSPGDAKALAAPQAAADGTVTATTSGGPTLDEFLRHGGPPVRVGSATQAGLVPTYVDQIAEDLVAGLQPGSGSGDHPEYPGGVVLAAHKGVIAQYAAAGFNLRYADVQGDELPRDQWISTTKDTIYDLASLTKLFTAVVAMQLIESGRMSLDDTVASFLPQFAQNGKGGITIHQLMTHTSGMPPDPSPGLWTYDTYQEKVDAVYATTLINPPGSSYVYSDLSMITLQFVEQEISGKTLDVLVRDGITGPLGMTDTMFNPPASLKHRIAAEEYESTADRGLVWGEVHDENAWALGGVAGHAGLFSTAHDLAIWAQALLNGGTYQGTRILSRDSVLKMWTHDPDYPGPDGLVFELYQHWEMAGLATPYTVGHTGFTGTSIVIDPTTDSFVILLTNAVHPSRTWGSTNPARRAVADDLARAIPVHPKSGHDAWFGGRQNRTTATLTVPLTLPADAALGFDLWYDTEAYYDFCYLEASGNGGASWHQVPFSLHGDRLDIGTPGKISGYEGHQWLRASADLSTYTGTTKIRWRYVTDPLYHGRGVYVDGVTVTAGQRTVFNGNRPADAATFQADGWVRSRN